MSFMSNTKRLLNGKIILVNGEELKEVRTEAKIGEYVSEDGRHLVIHAKENNMFEAILIKPLMEF